MPSLLLRNDHTGETIELRRGADGSADRLELACSLPPGRASMSVHAHRMQDLTVTVRSGLLRVLVEDRTADVPAGESLSIPRGTPYRLWNENPEPVHYVAVADPAGDLDRYLQGYFQVVNAGERDRPPLGYLARLQLRYRHTQSIRLLAPVLQVPLFMTAAAAGVLLGRFRGRDWPGAPERCPGLPESRAGTG